MKFIELFEKSPTGRTMMEKWEKSAKQSADATRRENRTKLDRVEESRLKGVKERRPGLEKRRDAIADLEQQLRDARQALARDHAHDGAERHRHEVDCDRLEESLRTTADPKILEFIDRMEGDRLALRGWNIASSLEPTGTIDQSTGAEIMTRYSEAMSLRRRLQGLRDAAESARALQLRVGVDLEKCLSDINEGVPVIAMEEVGA